MSLKTFLLGRMNRAFGRPDLPPYESASHTVGDASVALHDAAYARPPQQPRAAVGLEHLGAYRPLVAAIREELERFVATDLRLHLAIAERDRYVLTSISIESVGPDETRTLLTRFVREFAPEQVKHYLAREIIARLPNASAIDLTQFAGLEAGAEAAAASRSDYDDLLEELRTDEPEVAKPYEVTLVGRWSDAERGPERAPAKRAPAAVNATPLAGRGMDVVIDDAQGARRVALSSVVPGRRYTVGKDAGCDVVVDGVYASRRHCEVWLDKGTWWVTDCGSTNGIRVEPAGGEGASLASAKGDGKALAVEPGARVVLSASGQGTAAQYPRFGLSPVDAAPRASATPVTPIVAAVRTRASFAIDAHMASGDKTFTLPAEGAFRIGRSRAQSLVVDWAHESVSGHHAEIVGVEEAGVRVRVHGDNGVRLAGGEQHGAGSEFTWKVGQTLVLGHPVDAEPACTLTLAHAS
jgi:pSer/pThr/pTyr-binding forkhead associated (FHA) protein